MDKVQRMEKLRERADILLRELKERGNSYSESWMRRFLQTMEDLGYFNSETGEFHPNARNQLVSVLTKYFGEYNDPEATERALEHMKAVENYLQHYLKRPDPVYWESEVKRNIHVLRVLLEAVTSRSS